MRWVWPAGGAPVGGLRGMGAHGILRKWAHVLFNSRRPGVRSRGLTMAAYCRNVEQYLVADILRCGFALFVTSASGANLPMTRGG